MKNVLFSILGALALSGVSRAQTIPTIVGVEAPSHVGQLVVATGRVARISISSLGKELLDIDKAYPNESFTVVIPKFAINRVGPINALLGQQAAFEGYILAGSGGDYKIYVTNRQQIAPKSLGN